MESVINGYVPLIPSCSFHELVELELLRVIFNDVACNSNLQAPLSPKACPPRWFSGGTCRALCTIEITCRLKPNSSFILRKLGPAHG